jgi:hypothetical protein
MVATICEYSPYSRDRIQKQNVAYLGHTCLSWEVAEHRSEDTAIVYRKSGMVFNSPVFRIFGFACLHCLGLASRDAPTTLPRFTDVNRQRMPRRTVLSRIIVNSIAEPGISSPATGKQWGDHVTPRFDASNIPSQRAGSDNVQLVGICYIFQIRALLYRLFAGYSIPNTPSVIPLAPSAHRTSSS